MHDKQFRKKINDFLNFYLEPRIASARPIRQGREKERTMQWRCVGATDRKRKEKKKEKERKRERKGNCTS